MSARQRCDLCTRYGAKAETVYSTIRGPSTHLLCSDCVKWFKQCGRSADAINERGDFFRGIKRQGAA